MVSLAYANNHFTVVTSELCAFILKQIEICKQLGTPAILDDVREMCDCKNDIQVEIYARKIKMR